MPLNNYDTDLSNVPLFTGDIYYVDGNQADNSGDGLSPGTAKKTIGAGIAAMGDGDALTIKAGTYTETGLDLSNKAAEMWFEIGVIIDPASGTALTVSGDNCRMTGGVQITPAAGAVGLLLSGNYARIGDIGGPTIIGGATGIQVTGSGCVVRNPACGFQTTQAYNIQGIQFRLYDGSTVGNGATIGYHINNGVDTGVLRNCTSTGHTTAGYYIDTLSKDWTILNCSSGAGDGRWVDVDTVNVWSNFTFDDEVYHTTDWSVVGGAGASDNLFLVTGSVDITFIYGNVETQLHADVDNLKLEADDGTVQTDITANVDTASAPVGSMFIKTKTLGEAMALEASSQVRLNEDSVGKKGALPFIITAKNGVNTYIRCTWSGAGNTGKVHWHCRWDPLSEDGFVATV